MASFRFLAAGGANQDSQLVVGGRSGWLRAFAIYNLAAAIRYVKIYDKATAPLSTDAPLLTIALNANREAELQLPEDTTCSFGAGLGIRITVGQADNDVAAATAGDVVVNLVYR